MTITFLERVVAGTFIFLGLTIALLIVDLVYDNQDLRKQLAKNDVKIRELKTSCNRHLVVVEDSAGFSIYEVEKK